MSLLRLITVGGLCISLGYAIYMAALRTRAVGYDDAPRASSAANPASGPLRVSQQNPRYLAAPDGRAVYLTGSHTWSNLQEMRGFRRGTTVEGLGGYDAYLAFLRQHNHNFIRLWILEHAWDSSQEEGPVQVSPLPFRRTGPGNAADGKPKFDLSQLDPEFFDRLRYRVEEAGRHGIYVSVMLFDDWSTENVSSWEGHPFHRENNVNGIDGDLDGDGLGIEVHTRKDPRILEFQHAYVRKVIDTINDLDNVLFEIANETGASRQWQYDMISFIRDYKSKSPKQHPIGMTVGWPVLEVDNAGIFASSADWVSPNPEGGYIDDPPAATGEKVILTDTDHYGDVGDRSAWVWKSFTRGLNPIYMEDLSDSAAHRDARTAMGATLRVASSMNLSAMIPIPELSSSKYCMASPGREYVIYIPPLTPRTRWKVTGRLYWRQAVEVDLTQASGQFRVEWISPSSGEVVATGFTEAGTKRTFKAPRPGAAVLRLSRR